MFAIFPTDARIAVAKEREGRGKGQDGKNDFLTVSPRRWKSGRLKPPAILGR